MSDGHYVVIEGVVENLEIYGTREQFLPGAGIRQRRAGVAAVMQAAAGEPGASHSAQAASDLGDPVEAYRMSIGPWTVSGSFWRTTFNNSDHVKVVGAERDRVFHAVAVLRPADGVIWMQPHCERGSAAKRRQLARNSFLFAAGVFLVEAFLLRNASIPLWLLLLTSLTGVTVVLGATVGMSWKDFMFFAAKMDKIGEALAVSANEDIDLFKSTRLARQQGWPDLPMGVYYFADFS